MVTAALAGLIDCSDFMREPCFSGRCFLLAISVLL
jgi:hypothetical protein